MASLFGTALQDRLKGGDEADILDGLGAADTLQGGAGDDTLLGGEGDDRLLGDAGDDLIDGGWGEADLADYSGATEGVTVDLAIGGPQAVGGGHGIDTLKWVEGLVGGAYADTLSGDALGNLISGGAGADRLFGRDGDDTLSAGQGDDELDGGAGRDLADFTDRGATRADLSIAGRQPDGGEGQLLLIGIEDLRGGRLADTLVGDAGGNRLSGGSGADSLAGGAGDDTLAGELGGDTLSGGAGRDAFFGGPVDRDVAAAPDRILDWTAGEDRLFFSDTAGGVYLEGSAASYADAYGYAMTMISGGSARYMAIQAGGDVAVFADALGNGGISHAVILAGRTLADVSAASIHGAAGGGGWAGDEYLRLTTGADTYDGGGGADSLEGMAGDDSLSGGAGQDWLRGGDGSDRISGGDAFDDTHGNAGDDTVNGGGGDDWVVGGKDNDRLFGDDGDDIVYGNLGNDTCEGGEGADIVRGGQGNDVIYGGDGDDWLSGDRDNDTLTGGAGADIFHTFAQAGIDKVTDFNYAQGDRVQLDPGVVYTLRQVDNDVWIVMGGSNEMVLVDVRLDALPSDWIFGA
jgi:Ca2+-binding RTX toxin-like protein